MRMSFRMCLSAVLCAAMVSGAYAANYTSDTTIGDKDEGNTKPVIYSGVTVTVNGAWTNINGMQVGSSTPGDPATLLIDGGSVNMIGTMQLGKSSPGVLEVSNNGSFTYSGTSNITFGQDRDASISMSSGAMTFGYTVVLGAAAVNVDYTQTGGAFSVNAASLRIGGAAGSIADMTISGGTFVVDKQLSLGYSSTGHGTFKVEGGGASQILLNAINDGASSFIVNGTDRSVLEFAIGAADATTGFNVTRIDAYGANLAAGAIIDMSLFAGFTASSGQTFDLLKNLNGTLDISALQLAAGDSENWTLQTNLDGDTLQAVYTAVPEPATMGLLGLGLAGLVARRRKQ